MSYAMFNLDHITYAFKAFPVMVVHHAEGGGEGGTADQCFRNGILGRPIIITSCSSMYQDLSRPCFNVCMYVQGILVLVIWVDTG